MEEGGTEVMSCLVTSIAAFVEREDVCRVEVKERPPFHFRLALPRDCAYRPLSGVGITP
jgi:hypothetical protein